MEVAQSLIYEYMKQFSALNDEERKLEHKKSQLQLLQKQLKEAQGIGKNGWLDHVAWVWTKYVPRLIEWT